jgi:pyrimidine-specific ribonucleoside hydrolase
MATDDWMAILYLLRRPGIAVKAIAVSGAGMAHCEPGMRHARGLVALAGAGDIPVACGREMPLQGGHSFPAPWREDTDKLAYLKPPETSDSAAKLSAVDLLTSSIQSSPQKVVVLTLGPLTNLAEALQRTPVLASNLEMVYIMGGAVGVPGNVAGADVRIDNQAAEWNMYVDPQAADIVLRSGAPITLIPLDATNHVPMTATFYGRLKDDHGSPEATFVFDLLTKQYGSLESGGYYFWDPLAAAILTNEGLGTFETKRLSIVTQEGPESGRTLLAANGSTVRVAVSADGSRFEQLFLDTLNDR